MKNFKLKNVLFAAITLAVLSSCHKDKNDITPDKPTAQRAGIYLLNQGSFNTPNGTLTYYDYTTKKTTADIFSTANSRGLGTTPNDLKIYGSKMYIVVNQSNKVEVVDPKTAKSIKQIDFGTRGPRSIAFYKNNAFVTSYDGTVAVIDTAALTTGKFITVGKNPEQLVVANGKLYVANSGGLSATFDNTVSVIDLNTLTETKKITVIANPVSIAADANGHVYALSNGDFGSVSAGITIIDNTTDAVVTTKAVPIAYGTSMAINGDVAYYVTDDNKIAVYNTKTLAVTNANFITDGTAIKVAYNVAVDTTTGEVFVTDAIDYSSNGTLYAFDKTGKKEYSITTGINPANIAFINK